MSLPLILFSDELNLIAIFGKNVSNNNTYLQTVNTKGCSIRYWKNQEYLNRILCIPNDGAFVFICFHFYEQIARFGADLLHLVRGLSVHVPSLISWKVLFPSQTQQLKGYNCDTSAWVVWTSDFLQKRRKKRSRIKPKSILYAIVVQYFVYTNPMYVLDKWKIFFKWIVTLRTYKNAFVTINNYHVFSPDTVY